MIVRPPARDRLTIPLFSRAVAVALAAVLLAGCISLFPKAKPVQLYRFGVQPEAGAERVPRAREGTFVVRAVTSSFDRASASDRILTVNGDRTAYIAGARWVISATSLFDAAVTNAFDAHGGSARLLAPGERARADYTLKLDVRSFEARYDGGPEAAPTVVVEVYAGLNSSSDPAKDSDRIFQVKVPAAENRVGAITSAFDQATGKVLGELVAWVDAKGAA